jgi:hypothetical protein
MDNHLEKIRYQLLNIVKNKLKVYLLKFKIWHKSEHLRTFIKCVCVEKFIIFSLVDANFIIKLNSKHIFMWGNFQAWHTFKWEAKWENFCILLYKN